MRKSEEEERKGRTRREDLGTRREGRRKDRERPFQCSSYGTPGQPAGDCTMGQARARAPVICTLLKQRPHLFRHRGRCGEWDPVLNEPHTHDLGASLLLLGCPEGVALQFKVSL